MREYFAFAFVRQQRVHLGEWNPADLIDFLVRGKAMVLDRFHAVPANALWAALTIDVVTCRDGIAECTFVTGFFMDFANCGAFVAFVAISFALGEAPIVVVRTMHHEDTLSASYFLDQDASRGTHEEIAHNQARNFLRDARCHTWGNSRAADCDAFLSNPATIPAEKLTSLDSRLA